MIRNDLVIFKFIYACIPQKEKKLEILNGKLYFYIFVLFLVGFHIYYQCVRGCVLTVNSA